MLVNTFHGIAICLVVSDLECIRSVFSLHLFIAGFALAACIAYRTVSKEMCSGVKMIFSSFCYCFVELHSTMEAML